MRTTLTLDDDVAAALRHRAQAHGVGWKQLVNQALRLGLGQLEEEEVPRGPYRTPASDLGEIAPALRCDHSVHEMLVLAEGEGYR